MVQNTPAVSFAPRLQSSGLQQTIAADPDLTRRYLLAQALSQVGSSTAPVRSIAEGLTRLASAGFGTYATGRTLEDAKTQRTAENRRYADALRMGQGQPGGFEPNAGVMGDGNTVVNPGAPQGINWTPVKPDRTAMIAALMNDPSERLQDIGRGQQARMFERQDKKDDLRFGKGLDLEFAPKIASAVEEAKTPAVVDRG